MGVAVRAVHAWIAYLVLCAAPVAAAERYAVVITGASGGVQYAKKYDGWRDAFVGTLEQKLGLPRDHIVVLAEEAAPPVRRATREGVRAVFQDFARHVAQDDVLLVLLIGHGTSGDEGARFNLVGPDLTAADWAGLIKPIAGRVVFVNAASGSFEFLETLAGRGRIVLTAADSAAQQYETVFPQFFIEAFTSEQADLDRDGRVSIWEAFQSASAGVKNWFDDQNRLATERAVLDDNGDGIGTEAGGAGTSGRPDGQLAQVTHLNREDPGSATADAELAALLRQRAAVQSRIEQLRADKANLPPDRYESELETLLVELARLERQIRSRS
jgi:hypothetical protein